MRVHENNLMLVDWYSMLDIPGKLLVQDNKDYDLEALRGQMNKIRYRLAL